MFYSNNVSEVRLMYFTSWEKYNQKKALLPLEQQIVQVILDHPEYHLLLNNTPQHADHTYFPELGETNPFLHMGLHLAVREQVATDRPIGITAIYHQLTLKKSDHLAAEHLLMESLAECLWNAQRQQTMPDEACYLNACRQWCLL